MLYVDLIFYTLVPLTNPNLHRRRPTNTSFALLHHTVLLPMSVYVHTPFQAIKCEFALNA